MSFFGITALGPQNSFQSHLVNAIGLKLFSREEYKEAFDRLDRDRSGYIEADEVEQLLRETYQMEPLEEEVIMFMQQFDANQDGKVSWEEFCRAADDIMNDLEQKASRASEIKSHEEWMFKRRKHIRIPTDTTEKYRKPMTYNQSIGFYDVQQERTKPTATRQSFYRPRCQETKYADAIISAGHHFT